ncbi:MAG: hypothetical protein U5K54_11920 [Cytophagales bacterium]|nr:hypothetical protein [Cytophagales bacterium]
MLTEEFQLNEKLSEKNCRIKAIRAETLLKFCTMIAAYMGLHPIGAAAGGGT